MSDEELYDEKSGSDDYIAALEDDGADSGFVDGESIEINDNLPVYQLYLPYSHETVFASYRGEEIPMGEIIASGTYVMVPTRYGRDMAVIKRALPLGYKQVQRVVWIARLANDADREREKDFARQEQEAFALCKEKIDTRGLDMKLVQAHYLLDEPKIIFFFTSENRVDFRELVKDLVNIFKIRIELRQIGIRDESRILGGIGHCGREFCCHAVCDRLKSVSIKMAKDQSLSLNSMKISGHCGRLLCCLSFESQFYNEQRKFLPPEGCRIGYMDTLWKVIESNVIVGVVTMSAEDGRTIRLNKTKFQRVENRWTVCENAVDAGDAEG
jgi:cell fate regulator YaaT (PSP1 superfamily)